MQRKLIAVVVLGAIGVGALATSFGLLGASAAATTEYLTAAVARGDVSDDIAATGSLAPITRTGLAFGLEPFLVGDAAAPAGDATYRVTSVDVQVGDEVAAGDAIATAESTDLERQLHAAKNDLASANVSFLTASDNLDDAEDDEDKDRIRQAKIGLYDAKNRLADARARVDELQAQLDGATLVAPVDGVVSEVAIQAGYDAPAGAAVVIDASTYQVTADVVESDLPSIRIGQAASVRVDAVDAELKGTVTAISPVAGDASSGVVRYPVTITLDEAPAASRSGMSADVTVTIASATDVLTVPAAALQGRADDYAVLILGADGAPVRTAVTVGLVTNTLAEITSGLAEGQQVVTGTTSDLAGTTNNQGNGVFQPGGGNIVGPGGGQGPIIRQDFP